MKTLGIIPARYGSTRFPGKPLAIIHGKSMIRRVYERAVKAKLLSAVLVATDDERIFDHVSGFGGNVVMTSPQHPSGTDRCAEALKLTGNDFNYVVNIQGDEPYIHPDQIDLLVECMASQNSDIATLVKVITDKSDLINPNIPKVVRTQQGRALYFSRRPIPYCKDEISDEYLRKGIFLKHIGIYGYRAIVLPQLAALPQGKMELCESLEQLRWLEHGFVIDTAVSIHENIAVDSPSDIDVIESRFSVSD